MSPRAFTQEEKEKVKEMLLAAAKRFLGTTGIKKTSVEELAHAAGISKGAFYLFYDSKELLFMDALDREQAKIHQKLIESIADAKDTKTGFVQTVMQMADDFLEKPWLMAFSGQDYELLLSRIPPERIMRHIEQDDASSKRFCETLGLTGRVSPELLSAALRMLFIGMLHQKEAGPNAKEAFLFLLTAVAEKLF